MAAIHTDLLCSQPMVNEEPLVSMDDDSSVVSQDYSEKAKQLATELQELIAFNNRTKSEILALDKDLHLLKFQNNQDMEKCRHMEEQNEKLKHDTYSLKCQQHELLFLENLIASGLLNEVDKEMCNKIKAKHMRKEYREDIVMEAEIREDISVKNFKSIHLKLGIHEKQLFVKQSHHKNKNV